MRIHTPLLIAALAFTACGEPSSEQRIADATAQVERAEAELEAARQRVEREEQELEAAREELAEAREALRDAETRVQEARDRVAEVADDAYLFRTVQSALLAERKLEGLAIAARVRDGVVTLEGRVPDSSQKKRAGEIAAGVELAVQ